MLLGKIKKKKKTFYREKKRKTLGISTCIVFQDLNADGLATCDKNAQPTTNAVPFGKVKHFEFPAPRNFYDAKEVFVF